MGEYSPGGQLSPWPELVWESDPKGSRPGFNHPIPVDGATENTAQACARDSHLSLGRLRQRRPVSDKALCEAALVLAPAPDSGCDSNSSSSQGHRLVTGKASGCSTHGHPGGGSVKSPPSKIQTPQSRAPGSRE